MSGAGQLLVSILPALAVGCIHSWNCVWSAPTSTSDDFGSFQNRIDLATDGVFTLRWNASGVAQGKIDETVELTIQLQAKTTGWLGLGFSESGGMKESDIIVGGVKDGVAYFQAYYAAANELPRTQGNAEHQVYKLLDAHENETHTTLTFVRRINLCGFSTDDSGRFYQIDAETTKLIWAFGNADAHSGLQDVHYHGETKGQKSLRLLRSPIEATGADTTPGSFELEIRMERVSVKANQLPDWKAWCKLVDVSSLAANISGFHLTKYQMIADPPENRRWIHHMNLDECLGDVAQYAANPDEAEGFCYEPNAAGKMFQAYKTCNRQWITTWSATPVIMPEAIGSTVLTNTTKNQKRYFMLEVHYDNNVTEDLLDSSGFRLHFEPAQTQVAGGMSLGLPINGERTIIPPKFAALSTYGVCPSECTKTLPSTGITVFAVFLHSHTNARQVKLRHFRNGIELQPIGIDRHYDYSVQERYELATPVVILPGDTLVTECIHSTMLKDNVTLGGGELVEEMCQTFIEFYPKVPGFASCFSLPDVGTIATGLGLSQNASTAINLGEYADKSVTWSDAESQRRFVKAMTSGTYTATCGGTKTVVPKPLRRKRDAVPAGGSEDDNPEMPGQDGLRTFTGILLPDLTKPPADPISCTPKAQTGVVYYILMDPHGEENDWSTDPAHEKKPTASAMKAQVALTEFSAFTFIMTVHAMLIAFSSLLLRIC